RPSLPQMNRSRLSGVRAVAASCAPGGNTPPIERQLSLTPDQSAPLVHHDVYTRPSLPQMNRSSCPGLRETAVSGPIGKKPPIILQLSFTPDQSLVTTVTVSPVIRSAV